MQPTGKNKVEIVSYNRHMENISSTKIKSRILSSCDNIVLLPCGKCNGCAIDRAKEWTIRGFNESIYSENNYFVTLTYDNNNVKRGIKKDVYQKFLKRLRKICGEDIKYLGCGEYGEKFHRPHFHFCLFNCNLGELNYNSVNDIRNGIGHSKILVDTWEYGIHSVDNFGAAAAGYTARYTVKKIKDWSDEKGRYISRKYGIDKIAPYNMMSLKPGLGYKYCIENYREIYERNYIKMGKLSFPIPRYYDKLLETLNPKMYKQVKERRLEYVTSGQDLTEVTECDRKIDELMSGKKAMDSKIDRYLHRRYEENEI